MAAAENPLLRQLQERLAKVKQENSVDVGLKSEKKEDVNPSPKRVCSSTDKQLKALPGNTALVKAACSKTSQLSCRCVALRMLLILRDPVGRKSWTTSSHGETWTQPAACSFRIQLWLCQRCWPVAMGIRTSRTACR